MEALFYGLLGVWFGYVLRTIEAVSAELTARVDDVAKMVDSCEVDAERYWAEKPEPWPDDIADPQGTRLAARLHRLTQMVEACAAAENAFQDKRLTDAVRAFNRAITSGDFQARSRGPEPQRSAAILSAGTELLVAVRKLRRDALAYLWLGPLPPIWKNCRSADRWMLKKVQGWLNS